MAYPKGKRFIYGLKEGSVRFRACEMMFRNNSKACGWIFCKRNSSLSMCRKDSGRIFFFLKFFFKE